MIPCHSAALRCTWPFAVTCMPPSSIENEIAHLTVAAFSSHLSRLRREERLVMTAYVSPDKGLFHCHGCKVGGDMLTFVQRFKGLRFPEALAEAAQTLGLALPAPTPEEPRLARLAATADIAADIFASWLWHDVGKPA